MNPETLLRLPPILQVPLFVIPLFWVALALGYRLLRWSRLPTSNLTPVEFGYLASTFGVGALQALPLTLAAAGLMKPAIVRGACSALVVLLLPDLLRVARAGFRQVRRASAASLGRPARVWLSLFGVLLGLLLVRALVFRPAGDDDGYHLMAPKRWLEMGTLGYLPSYTHTNASAGFEMLYVIALSWTDVVGAKLIHYVAGLYSLLGLVLCARRLGSVFAGVLTVSLLLVPTALCDLPFLFGVAYVDFGALWMCVASALCWLLWRERHPLSLLTCMGLCAGLAGSFKFTSLVIVFAWLPALAREERLRDKSWRQCLGTVVWFGACAAVPIAPWFLKNWLVTGNPLYPMLYQWIPTRDWNEAHAAIFSRYIHYYSWGVDARERLGDTARKLLVLAAVALVIVAGGLAIAFAKRHVLRSLLMFSIIFMVVSLTQTGLVFRYFVPAMAVALLAVAVYAEPWFRTKSWRHGLACALLVLAIVRAGLPGPKRTTVVKNFMIATGLRSFDDEYPDDEYLSTWSFINHATPPGSRVLAAAFYNSLGMSSFGGFLSDRTLFTTDSHLQTYIELDEWPSFVESVGHAGITHVLILHEETVPHRQGFTFRAADNEYRFCRRLAETYGHLVHEAGTLEVYEVSVAAALAALPPRPAPPAKAAGGAPAEREHGRRTDESRGVSHEN